MAQPIRDGVGHRAPARLSGAMQCLGALRRSLQVAENFANVNFVQSFAVSVLVHNLRVADPEVLCQKYFSQFATLKA